MKFWELVSIFRSDPLILEKLIQDSDWHPYFDWFRNFEKHVVSQNREVLDSVVPHDLAASAMKLCNLRFRIEDGFLYQFSGTIPPPGSLAAIEVHNIYGGLR